MTVQQDNYNERSSRKYGWIPEWYDASAFDDVLTEKRNSNVNMVYLQMDIVEEIHIVGYTMIEWKT